jgi:hypothetical protein
MDSTTKTNGNGEGPGSMAFVPKDTEAKIVALLASRMGKASKLPEERQVSTVLLHMAQDRIVAGYETYGSWRLDDGRNYPQEALAEAVDGMNYVAAELLRIDAEPFSATGFAEREALLMLLDALHRVAGSLLILSAKRQQVLDAKTPAGDEELPPTERSPKPGPGTRVFVCLAESESEVETRLTTQTICLDLLCRGYIPIAPTLYIPAVFGKETDGPLAKQTRMALLAACDELWFFGQCVTATQLADIQEADRRGMPVRMSSVEVMS